MSVIAVAFVAIIAYGTVCVARAQLSGPGGAPRWLRLFAAAVRGDGRP